MERQPMTSPYREGGTNDRVLHGALPRLEPYAVKVARTVLRGRGGGNVALLPDVRSSLGSGIARHINGCYT